MEMLNDGILSIDETEGEDISLTAELPSDQFTDEEKLQIESEKEDGDDEVKRIDLFASEEQGDPLNNLLLGEDGITILIVALIATLVYELFGPIGVKYSLEQAGEISK